MMEPKALDDESRKALSTIIEAVRKEAYRKVSVPPHLIIDPTSLFGLKKAFEMASIDDPKIDLSNALNEPLKSKFKEMKNEQEQRESEEFMQELSKI